MMAFYFIDSVLKQSQMLADRRDPRGVMFTGLHYIDVMNILDINYACNKCKTQFIEST